MFVGWGGVGWEEGDGWALGVQVGRETPYVHGGAT